MSITSITFEKHSYRTRLWHMQLGYLGSIYRPWSEGKRVYAAGCNSDQYKIPLKNFSSRAKAAQYLYNEAVAQAVKEVA